MTPKMTMFSNTSTLLKLLIPQLMLIWLKNSTQNKQNYMQIWRISISPLGASKNFPGHVTIYFRTSMSEASPPQGPDMWYLTFYQNKVLIYQDIVPISLSFQIMVRGISIVVQGSTVRQSSDKSFLMPLSLVYDTKMSMLDLKSKRVICPSIHGTHERFCTWKILIKLTTSFSCAKYKKN